MPDSHSNISIEQQAAGIIVERVRKKIGGIGGDIYLFGSRAEQRHKPGSDYDLAIFLDAAPPVLLSSKQNEVEHYLQQVLGQRFSVFIFVKVGGNCLPPNFAIFHLLRF